MSYTIGQKKAIYTNLVDAFGEREFRASDLYERTYKGYDGHYRASLKDGLASPDVLTRSGLVTVRTVTEPIPSRAVLDVVYIAKDGREVLRRKDVTRDKVRRAEIEQRGGTDAAIIAATREHLTTEIKQLLDLVDATAHVERNGSASTRTVKLYRVNPEWGAIADAEEREEREKTAAKAAAKAARAAEVAAKAAAKAARLKAEADRLAIAA